MPAQTPGPADRLVATRAKRIDASGIRRVFDLGAKLKDPINLSIGQPDFPVPDAIKRAAIEAIERDRNGYTPTQGVAPLRERLTAHLKQDVGWSFGDSGDPGLLVTSGTSGALVLLAHALLDPGDEIVIPDPYFVMYPHLATLVGAKAVLCDTYPDFVMTAERVEPLIGPRTKMVLLNSPGNPTGAVASREQCRELLELCRRKGVLLVSDEIYDEFTYSESRTDTTTERALCPSPARFEGAEDHVLLIRGLGKTYGVTGWRMGYAAGPRVIIEEMAKLQQYTFVCAPSVAQWGAISALDVDMSSHISAYQKRRDMVVEALSRHTNVTTPGGAFYAFPEVPKGLGRSATKFVERAIENNVLVIPGGVFSSRDTHFRLSFATDEAKLRQGLDVLSGLMQG
jgi:aspartate/methionine/tyrosine aminotransferase